MGRDFRLAGARRVVLIAKPVPNSENGDPAYFVVEGYLQQELFVVD